MISLGTVLFDLKEEEPFSQVGQNARTKNVIKPNIYWTVYGVVVPSSHVRLTIFFGKVHCIYPNGRLRALHI